MGWLFLHPSCFLGFFLASGSGAVDGRGGAFALGYLDEDEEDVGWAIDFSIAMFTDSTAFLAFDQQLFGHQSVHLQSCWATYAPCVCDHLPLLVYQQRPLHIPCELEGSW